MEMKEAFNYTMRILNEVDKVIVDKRPQIEVILAVILSNGHVLLEDYPGMAKTLAAKTLAKTLGCEFKRIQFTPDLLPADITGYNMYNQAEARFEFRPGPIFTNILLADEVNRAPPKTQAALLEAMQERQVTIDGVTYKMKTPFVVIATQNPIEYEGTYPLPEAQLDRFMVKIGLGYPDDRGEIEILSRRIARRSDYPEVERVVTQDIVVDMQVSLEDIYIENSLLKYIVDIVRATREHEAVAVGVSPRGGEMLMKLSRAYALIKGRDYVIPDDIKTLAIPSLAHRLVLKHEFWLRPVSPDKIIESILKEIPPPKV
jgi:MoxR-like ATPase